MNELSGKKPETLTDAEVIRLGFCPHCHCSEATVENTRKISCSGVREIGHEKKRVEILRIIRYRKCENCGNRFRTVESSLP